MKNKHISSEKQPSSLEFKLEEDWDEQETEVQTFLIHPWGILASSDFEGKNLFPTKSVAEHLLARGYLTRARLLGYCI